MSIPFYQVLKLCIDQKGHKFIVSRPPAGDYGYTITICERCGLTPGQVQK